MSDLELEKSAMALPRWIELCDAFEKQHINDPGAILRPRTTRVIKGSFATGINYNSSSCQVGDTC